MRMVLHCVADDVGDLDEAPVVLVVQRPKNAALDRLEAVRQVRDGAVADDVGGVVEEAAVDAAMERQFDLAGDERMRRRRHGDTLGEDVRGAVATFGRLGLRGFVIAVFRGGRCVDHARRIIRQFLNRQFLLAGIVLTFGCHGMILFPGSWLAW